ncbi:MAG: extracellular solute-binding protein [Ignavibacteria bacterium]|nr:extracellular solute-binding protein [Ignavibacteria bacterium]
MRLHLFCLFIVGLVHAGCNSSGKIPLVVYSPHGKEILSAFESAYEAVHPGVDVQWLDMGSQDVYDRVRTERQNPQADVWWGGPSTIFARAEAESLLELYRPSWEAAVPAEWKSSSHHWYGTLLTPEVIMYNNRVVSETEAPRDWDDLLDPKWKGKVIIRYPLASGTMRTIFSAFILRERDRSGDVEAGFAWLRQLDANTKTYTADPVQLYLKIAREEGLVSLWNLPDVVVQVRLNGYPFGYVIPRSGTPLITDCIALVKGTRRRDEAIRFYEFVTSTDGLLRQAHEFYRIPARRDIPRDQLPEWIRTLDLVPMTINWDTLAAHEREWMMRWDTEVKGRGRDQSGE